MSILNFLSPGLGENPGDYNRRDFKGNPLTARNGSGGRTHLEGEYYISNTHKNELPTWEDFKTNDTRINYIPMNYKKGDEGIRFAHLEPVTD